MAPSQRQYDIVLFGATGYTGKFTAEYIVRSQPTNLKWAVAGRSANKLELLVNEQLTPLNKDRTPPAVETASLDLAELKQLARKTRVLINTVGPYALHGSKVVQACAEEGTSYVDTTGEVPWVKEMIEKWEPTAKKTGAILIPQCGFESAVPDLFAYAIAAYIQRTYQRPTRRITSLLWALRARASGGTLDTVLTIASAYSISAIAAAMKPYSISPIPRPATHTSQGFLQQLARALFGVRNVGRGLGLASTAVTGSTNAAIVQRSWGLAPDFYGRSFEYEELASVRSRLRGVALHWALAMGGIAIALPPVRWLARRFVYQPGQGPTKEETARDFAEYRAVGEVERDGKEGELVKGRLYWKGGMYDVSGLMMVEAARGLLDGEPEGVSGGFVTPGSLGESYLERCRKSGLLIDVEG